MAGRRSLQADGDVRVAAVGAAPHGLRRTYLASLAELPRDQLVKT